MEPRLPEEKTMREVALDGLIADIEDKGEKPAILDRCHDRHFCRDIDVPYTAENIYTLIRLAVENYQRLKHDVPKQAMYLQQ